MAVVYRDYGSIDPYMAPENEVNVTSHRQVYQATHRGDGKRLPYMNRSFISFTYGGTPIEDFDLIATITGDRLDRKGYADFEDTVSTYSNLDGQYYWTTHYKTNQMDFVLSTDGIDQKTLDNFLHWFKAGITRELILAEHPNRAIMARVAQPPQLNLLPFEHPIEISISGVSYKTKTTLYKGDINLSLVMDQPHWYAIVNVLGKKVPGESGASDRYIDFWDDPFTGQQDISIFASQDALKILYEDGIPLGSMINDNMLLGNGAYANVNTNMLSKIYNPDTEVGAIIYDPSNNTGAVIAGPIVDASNRGIENLPSNTEAYFFYAGTAPSPTIISFTLTPQINDNMIVTPENSYTSDKKYNQFIIESVHKQILQFTTPNIWSSYNAAIKVFNEYVNAEYAWTEISTEIRNQVHHSAIRAWAIQCINYFKNNNITPDAALSDIKNCMHWVITDNNGALFPATFKFNSMTGQARGQFTYRVIGDTLPNDNAGWSSYGEILNTPREEDVGDMLKSNYITISDRNYATSSGEIHAWNENMPTNSHRILHDVDNGLSNIQIIYKNMYL